MAQHGENYRPRFNYRNGEPYRGPVSQAEVDAYTESLEEEFPCQGKGKGRSAVDPSAPGSSLSKSGTERKGSDTVERKKSDTVERKDKAAWEVSAVLDDAGTPPKEVWREKKAAEREAWRARLWLILAPGGVVVLVAWWVFEWIRKALQR